MPAYTNLPTTWQTELEKVTGAKPVIEVIFDPDSRNIQLNEKYEIVAMTTLRLRRNIDLKWANITSYSDVKVTFNDPDGYFDSKKASSPFHSEAVGLYQSHDAGDVTILIDSESDVEFQAGETLYIEGFNPSTSGNRTNSETVTIEDFSKGTTYHTIVLTTGLTYGYITDTLIRTRKIEDTEIQIKISFEGLTNKIKILSGRLLNAPVLKSGRATLILVDSAKIELDRQLTGATSGANKLKGYDSTGTLVDTTKVTNSVTFDRSKVHIFDGCKLGQVTATFSDANTYVLSGLDIGNIERDIRYGYISNLPTDNDLQGNNVVTDGSYLYLVSFITQYFTIVDVTTPASPTKRGTLAMGATPNPFQVAVSGNYAYVILGLLGTGTLTSIDISDKDNPAISDTITETDISDSDFDPTGRIKISGNYAYVTSSGAGGDGGLYIFDITDPTNMSLAGKIKGDANKVNYISDLYIDGNTCYTLVNGTTNYITTIDVTNKAAPVLSASTAITGTLKYMDKSTNYLIVTQPTLDRVSIFDITTPSAITLTGYIEGGGAPNYLQSAYNVVVSGDYAYVASGWDHSLVVIDITTKASPTLLEAVSSSGAPYYLGSINGLCTDSGYFYVTSSIDGITTFRLAPPIKTRSDGINFEIVPEVWGGTAIDGDIVTFVTGKVINNVNVIEAIYDLHVDNIGTENKNIHCSSFFGAKEVGTLYEGAAATDITIKVACEVPLLLKTSETLTITEGATTEDVTIATGNTVNTQYPPYVDLTISALANTYTVAATVTWKQRGAIDTDFSFDAEYNYCDTNNLNIKLCFDKRSTQNQAVELLALHAQSSIVFHDNWGVTKIYNPYRDYGISSYDQIHKDTNLKLPEPIAKSMEMINVFNSQYAYDNVNQRFTSNYTYPENDDLNQSFIMHGFKRERNLSFPGYYDLTVINFLADSFYKYWKNGIKLIEFNTTLQGLITTIGDHYNLVCAEPFINKNIAIISIKGVKLFKNYHFSFTGIPV